MSTILNELSSDRHYTMFWSQTFVDKCCKWTFWFDKFILC